MEILQFLISFFLNEYGGEKLQSVFKVLKDNSFDIGKVIKNLTPETVAPILKEFLKPNKNNTPTDFSVGEDYKLDPIARIADKDIVYTLNRYFN